MGDQVRQRTYTHADLRRYRGKMRRCLSTLGLMLDSGQFEGDELLTGVELEINLIDDAGRASLKNAEVLAYLAESDAYNEVSVQPELGQYNLELNLAPRSIANGGFGAYEQDLRHMLHEVDERARKTGSTLVLVGTLPTLRHADATEESLSVNLRYRMLNDSIINARGDDIELDIRGAERLRVYTDSIAPEAANTSVQFHIQVGPESFAAYYNAAQVLAGAQLVVGANAPYLFDTQLWAETRIALFEQATDTRSRELKAQGVRPRVWFGERWARSVLDLFEENSRYFPPLLPESHAEDPFEVWRSGGVPKLPELRLHNGTVYRWNRPVYDVGANGRPHLRVENRVLPAGPTVVDVLANMAFYMGAVRMLAESDHPVWTRMPFGVAEQNLQAAARDGIHARQWWPGIGEVDGVRLVDEVLLPLAYEGLDRFGVDPGERDRLLGVIEARCRSRVNGASWQVASVGHFEETRGRTEALREMLKLYARNAASGAAVHEWGPAK
ncbi:MAG TPA: glutamate--cysteine ligase [Phytomonospora sp.]